MEGKGYFNQIYGCWEVYWLSHSTLACMENEHKDDDDDEITSIGLTKIGVPVRLGVFEMSVMIANYLLCHSQRKSNVSKLFTKSNDLFMCGYV